jgi:MFS transporter, Spinster family, sphingosine-1-phosphate transporter
VIKSPAAILVLLTALNLVNYIDRFLVMAVGPKFQGELHLTDGGLGLVESAFMIGYMIMSPLFGRLGDRYPRKGVIAAGVAAWSVATVVSGLATGMGSMLVARIAVGVGEASYATISPTIIDDLAPREAKSRWLAVFYAAIPVGAALGYVLGGALAPLGWRAAFFVCGGPGVLLAALVLLVREPARGHAHAAGGGTAAVYLDLFRNRPYRLTVLGYVAQTFAIGGFSAWAIPLLERKFWLPSEVGAQRFGVITAFAGLVGTAFGGMLADRIPGDDRTRVYLRVCAWSSAVAAPLAAIALLQPSAAGEAAAQSAAVPAFVALGVCQLIIFASTSPTNAALLLSVPPAMRASAMAASIFFIHLLGDMVSGPVIGVISDALHDSHERGSGGHGVQVGMYLLPVALGVSSFAWFRGAAAAPVTPRGTA